jgi:hypothetical protein
MFGGEPVWAAQRCLIWRQVPLARDIGPDGDKPFGDNAMRVDEFAAPVTMVPPRGARSPPGSGRLRTYAHRTDRCHTTTWHPLSSIADLLLKTDFIGNRSGQGRGHATRGAEGKVQH